MADDQVTQLTESIDRLNRHHGLSRSFLRGLASGAGGAVGAALVVAIIGYIIQQLAIIPLLKDEIQSFMLKLPTQLPQNQLNLPFKQLPASDTLPKEGF